MSKFIFITCMLFSVVKESNGQLKTDMPLTELLALVSKSNPDTNKVKLFLQLSNYYYTELTPTRRHLDSAFFFLKQAEKLGTEIHSLKWQHEVWCYLGKYYFRVEDINQSNDYHAKLEYDIKKTGDLNNQIKQWLDLSENIQAMDTFGLSRINCFQKIIQLCKQTNNIEKGLEFERNIADEQMKQGKLELAEVELLKVLARYKSYGFPNVHYIYNLLSITNNYKGNFNIALNYALMAIETMQKTKDTLPRTNFYTRLGYIYHELGQTEKSIECFKIVFQRDFPKPINCYVIRDAGVLVRDLIKQKKGNEALSFILDFSKKYPPADYYGKASLCRTLAYCYWALRKYKLSDKYMLEMIRLSPFLGKNNEIKQEVEYDIGKYYITTQQFLNAAYHFQISLSEAFSINDITMIKNIYFMLFKVDSATGNYVSAIKNLNQYQLLNDSIFNVTKSRQIEEVQVKFETEKKEKNIIILQKENLLQQKSLKQANYTRNFILAGIVLLLLIIGLLYHRYWFKQESNRDLEAKQKVIEKQNLSLHHLVNEKEWLLKEIHHRVKNNLHTITGLLDTQAGFLKSEEALLAISDSQHRVQAMSLIHQKLFQSDDLSTIEISGYIHELVDYLKHSFDTGRRILFELDIDFLVVSLSHSLPIGLILNESITNSIKYAFPSNRIGLIKISLKQLKLHQYLLTIADNGKGLPSGFDYQKSGTMGMSLMQGLSEDIQAGFLITNNNGTEIKIHFSYDPVNDNNLAPLVYN